ncbi:glutamine-hydrolyzing asparagine synthase [Rhizoclosmatium globosum]|uniref:asparagine synthase (glutamine-hydrolyzing) n=1 Tax=Rhizoclosmatium globosum TaxID=329046 RepID=A0A1Y2BT69_9FUNG|nr:glutamine-hydrolyzing asparagine synthase [Rhizoclosmatium globosum]|eukprot:ORY37949.1 glutamine-hydrolyzing asparagine synthase [Rhizoclosmatium globosum]
MCGIFGAFGFDARDETFRDRAIALSKRIRHRGPDWSGVKQHKNNILCHERLAIVGVDSGAQPLTNEDDSIILAANGEIYNHVSLRKSLKKKHEFKTHSDCEVILYLYEEMGTDFITLLDGMFSFILYDAKKDLYIAARDPIGVTTLYQGWRYSDNSTWFASEMKSLHDECDRVIAFPPGHFYSSATGETTRYYNPTWFQHPAKQFPAADRPAPKQSLKEELEMYGNLRTTLEASVKKRLMSDVPFGVLLSGGLDSSLISSIAMRIMNEENKSSDDDDVKSIMSQASAWPRLHSFSIGLKGSPDLAAARRAADFLKTVHHEYTFTVQEGLDSISDVIYNLETYDVTTVRASTPMWLLSRKIKAMGVKMVLSGEGADEVYAGYLYFHAAPDAQSLHHETISRIQNLHTSDCLRANKSTMAWGLEARVPFLDKAFLDVSMLQVPPERKLSGAKSPYGQKMEKHVVRMAFDVHKIRELQKKAGVTKPSDLSNPAYFVHDTVLPYLPDEILWRQKEQFSDGVGYSWIDGLKDNAEKVVSDQEFERVKSGWMYKEDAPTTKEGVWYRRAFEKLFPQRACLESVVRWIPRKDWGCPEDPSGRAQKAHNAAYEKGAEAEAAVEESAPSAAAPAAPAAAAGGKKKKNKNKGGDSEQASKKAKV